MKTVEKSASNKKIAGSGMKTHPDQSLTTPDFNKLLYTWLIQTGVISYPNNEQYAICFVVNNRDLVIKDRFKLTYKQRFTKLYEHFCKCDSPSNCQRGKLWDENEMRNETQKFKGLFLWIWLNLGDKHRG